MAPLSGPGGRSPHGRPSGCSAGCSNGEAAIPLDADEHAIEAEYDALDGCWTPRSWPGAAAVPRRPPWADEACDGDATSSPRGGRLTEVPTPPRGRNQAASAATLGVPDAPGGSDGKPAAEDGAATASLPRAVGQADRVDLPHARGEAASSDGGSGCWRTAPRRRKGGRRRGGGVTGSNGSPAASGGAEAGSNGSPAAGGSAEAGGAVAETAAQPAATEGRPPAGPTSGGEAASCWEQAGLAGLPEAAQADALRARAAACRAFPEARDAATLLEAAAGDPAALGPAALLALAAAFRGF